MERGQVGGRGLSGHGGDPAPDGAQDLDGLLAGLGVSVPLRHAVSGLVSGPPSPVQSAALGPAVRGEDVLVVAPTGSGKTLVFATAVAHHLAGSPSLPGRPRALVISPTRELAVQSEDVLSTVGAGAGLRVSTFVGGRPLAADRRAVAAPVDVAAGTPGRLVELLRTRILDASDVKVLVLDEADQLLGASFAEQSAAVLDACPGATYLATTATAGPELEESLRRRRPGLAVRHVSVPVGAASPGSAVATNAPRSLVLVSAPDPGAVAVILAARCRRALVFVPRRDSVDPLRAAITASGVPATGVTGSASPNRRAAAFADLASGAVRVLVTTDLSGRGLDLPDVDHVIHVGPPHSAEDLVHRSGRTGRGDSDAGIVTAVVRPADIERLRGQASDAGMTVEVVTWTGGALPHRLATLFGPEIAVPRPRRSTAPPPRTRRPAPSRAHRPNRKRRT